MKLQTHDLQNKWSWFSQYAYLSTKTWYVRAKNYKGIDYALNRKSKELSTSKLKPLHTAFLNSIKISRYRMGIKIGKDQPSSFRTKQLCGQKCKCLHCLWFIYLAK